ncbi:MAG: TonB-dependent receptor, partial [Flavobacteriales bacterium]|nr:TonB-dependent receptor [Flavobacteriales bacterium]
MKKMIFLFVLITIPFSGLLSQGVQVIKGTIFDDASKSPLPGVNIIVVGTDPVIGASTDANGAFRLEKVPIGRQSLKITSIGYEDKLIPDIIVTTGKEVVLSIALTEAITTLGEITVNYDASQDKNKTINEMAQVSARSFNLEETKRYAGSLGDPSRMAMNFAGVVAGNDSRNDIVVRGNSPMGMLWQLEGLNVPNPNHFGALNSTGGPVNMINNNNLAKSDFFTSAFPASYGNANAGVFDLNMRKGNQDKHEFIGQIGFNGFEFGAEGPIGKNKKASYLINYRYSTLGVFHALGINFGTGSAIPLYQDVNYKFSFEIGKKGKLSIFGINGSSAVDLLGSESDTTQTDLYGNENSDIRVRYYTLINGISYEHQFNEKTSARIVAGYSRTYEKFAIDSLSPITRQSFHTGDAIFITDRYNAHAKLNHKFNAKNSLIAGIMADLIHIDLFDKDYINNQEVFSVNVNGDVFLAQGYAQWKHRFNNKLTFVGGVHSQWLNLNDSYSVEPRASLKWSIVPRHSLAIGYGMHSQMQPVYNYFVLTPTVNGAVETNKNMSFTKSQQGVLTYDFSITENMRIRTEAYYQYLYDVPVETQRSSFSTLNTGADFAPSDVDSLVNKGSGSNYGVELTLEKFFSDGYYFLITGSLFDSKYKGSDGVERNSAFNTKHVLNVLGGKEFKVGKKGNVFAFNVRSSWVGGKFLTPIDLAATQSAGYAIFDLNNA